MRTKSSLIKQNTYFFKALKGFEGSKKESIPLNQLEKIRKEAPKVRDKFIESGMPIAVHQFPCSTSPYPTAYGFHYSYSGMAPYLFFNNRATLVQFEIEGKIKNLLFNPYFPELSAQAPFYVALRKTMPGFVPTRLVLKTYGTIKEQLKRYGLTPEDIDYVSYDHLHVQDLRPLMGTDSLDALFPNAVFVFPKSEWQSVEYLHPSVSSWYVPDGIDGVAKENLFLYEGDLSIASGVALIHTPGHTPGNHSLYLNSPEGCFTISENGVGADAYSPEKSSIDSVRKTAAWKGWEVVMNANTLDNTFDQYNSMIKEKILSGPSPKFPEFINHRSSSEFTSHYLSPGLKPTIELGAVQFGEITLRN
ncbi:MAG: hypothetical protein JJT78_17380 [Leptospira sp.]|nr:hypothetical protein [Leptospira sp.]